MAVSAGTAALQVVPTLAKDFSRELATKMGGPAVKTANKTGADAGRTFGRRFGRTVSDETGKSGEKHGRRFGTSFSAGIRTGVGPVRGIMRGFGPGLAAAFGGVAITAAIKDVVNEAREAAAVGRQTSAVLKSTGGVANVSAKQVAGLAERLSNMSGVDDDLIQSGQNLLLTFTGIRNEAGKGNDVFNQASSAVLDLTASMNGGKITAQGLKASTIQVGKALNDPIKGMSALSRVGVTFNAQQKDQIKTLVESGDKLGAQKIILAELRKEFGGSAAASADAGKRFQVFIGNLKERIGGVLLPILNRFLEFLVDKLPGALAGLGRALKPVVTGVKVFFGALADPDITTTGAFGVIEKIASGLRSLFDLLVRGDFTRMFARIFNVAEDSPIVDTLFRIREGFIGLKKYIPAVVAGLVALLVATKVAAGISALSNGLAIATGAIKAFYVANAIGATSLQRLAAVTKAFMVTSLGPLAIVAVAVGAALLFFFRKTEAGKKVLEGLWQTVKQLGVLFVREVVPALAVAGAAFMKSLMPGLRSLGKVLVAQVLPALKVVAIVIGVVLYVALTKVLPLLLRIAGPVLGFLFKQIGQTIQWISNVVRFIGRLLGWLARWITGTKTTGQAIAELGRRVGVFAANMAAQWRKIIAQVTGFLSLLKRIWGAAVNWIRDRWNAGWATIRNIAATSWAKLRSGVGAFIARLRAIWNGGVTWVKDRWATISGQIRSIAATLWARLKASASTFVSGLKTVLGGIKGAFLAPFRGARRIANIFLAGVNSIAKRVGLGLSIPLIPKFQQGGIVGMGRGGKTPGAGQGDKVHALLEPGEVVIPNRTRDRQRLLRDRKVQQQLGIVGGDPGEAVLKLQKGGMVDRLSGLIGRVQNFIRSVDPLPYVWGGVGPGGYDCSGLMSEIVNRLTGRPSFHRLFSTSSIGPGVAGLQPGRGTFTIGTTPGTGHMAGNLAGLGAEARSSATGILTGNAARSVTSFSRQFFLPSAGGNFVNANGGINLFDIAGKLLSSLMGKLKGAVNSLGGGVVGQILKAVVGKIFDAAKSKLLSGVGIGGGGGGRGGLSAAEAWIIQRESGGRTTANNPTSSAFGLGQLLVGNRRHYARVLGFNVAAETAEGGTTDYSQQLAMFRAYVRDRYGSATAAKAFWEAHGWYDQGGWLQPGVTVAHNNTGHPERVLGAREQLIDYDKLGRAVAVALASQPVRAYMNPNDARQGVKEAQRQGGVPRDRLIR